MTQSPTQLVPLEAFCQHLPVVEQVTALLQELGFSLVFHLGSSPARPNWTIAALPSQYHYQDRYGTEVVFLAGKDTAGEEGVRYPPHQSHWWVYPGANPSVYQQVIAVLTAHWFMMWFLYKESQKEERKVL
jgi:hypothetical protein